MFDFHSHILPAMDDGSCSVEESLAMLRQSMAQGVTGIAATPHFHADAATPDQFLEARRQALESLKPYLGTHTPPIRLGAEVRYYDGMSRSEEILRLRMEGTSLLLVEMPMVRWTQHMCDVLVVLNSRREITVLLAHIERYLTLQPPDVLERLRGYGILMQASGTFFLRRSTRKRAMQMLQSGYIHVLGSDCHHAKKRPPNLGDAAAVIRKGLGAQSLMDLEGRENALMQGTPHPLLDGSDREIPF